MSKYETRQGDRLDMICWKYYGRYRSGTVEAVREANPHLADYGAVLPAGVKIELPALAQPVRDKVVIRLWD